MTASLSNNHISKGNVHISNYKKTLLSVFDKKKAWNYLSKQREKYQNNQEMVKHCLADQVIYH